MAGIDLTTAQTMLDAWIAAEQAVAKGQEYTIGNRRMRRADLSEIRNSVTFWNGEVQRLSANNGQPGIRVRGATPCG